MMTWKGPWDATTQYAQDDVVSYHGSSYIAVIPTPPIGQPPSLLQGWNVVAQAGAPGMVWRGVWQDGSYQIYDAVSYEGSSYIAISQVQKGDPPPFQNNQITNKWQLLAAQGLIGMTWRGDWDEKTIYQRNDAVRYDQDNGSYISLKENNQDHPPTDELWWQNISKDAEAQAANIAAIILSSIATLGTIANAIFSGKNALSGGITQALTTAANAATAAANAATTAGNALTTANNAATTAGNALTAANNATTTAGNALTTAANAATAAGNAVTTANNAVTTANQAIKNMQELGTALEKTSIYVEKNTAVIERIANYLTKKP